MRPPAILAAALLLACVGCGHPGAYLKDRAGDLADCFTIEFGPAIGVDAEVHVTDWLATGVGASASAKWGLAHGHLFGPGLSGREEVHLGFPVAPVLFWLDPQAPPPGRLRGVCTHFAVRNPGFAAGDEEALGEVFMSVLAYNAAALPEPWGLGAKRPGLADALNVDVGATLWPVSARVGLSPGHCLDFLLGWTTLDIADDDTLWRLPPPREKPVPCTCSPAESRIALAFIHDYKELWIACGTCPGKRKVVEFSGISSFSCSPDGRYIAVKVAEAIYVVAPNGQVVATVQTRQTADDSLSWSPRGDELAFVRNEGKRLDVHVATISDGAVSVARLGGTAGLDGEVAWAPDGRWVAFTNESESSPSEIWRIDVATKELLRLSPGGGSSRCPVWSPDSTRVAFLLERGQGDPDAGAALYVMGADGANARVIVPSGLACEPPAWSCDGTRIAYTKVAGRQRAVCTVEVETGRETTIAAHATSPSWSPDGHWLVFCLPRRGRPVALGKPRGSLVQVFIADRLGQRLRRVTQSDYGNRLPQWCPTQWLPPSARHQEVPEPPCSCSPADLRNTVAFASGKEVRLACTACLGKRKLVELPRVVRGLWWSPDGRSLAAVAGDDIYVVSQSGQVVGSVRTRSSWGASVSWSPRGDQFVFVSDEDVVLATVVEAGVSTSRLVATPTGKHDTAWAPNGKWVLFRVSYRGIYRLDVATRELLPLASSPAPGERLAWSPDSQRIAFVSGRTRALHIMDSDGRNPRQIGPAGLADCPFAWSPDGGRLAYTREADGERAVCVLDVATGREVPIATNASSPSWSPDGKWLVFRSTTDRGSEVFVADSQGKRSRQVTGNGRGNHSPQWRPR